MRCFIRLTTSLATTLFLIPKIAAVGNYEHCCEIQKCKNITRTCNQAPRLVDGLSCNQKCLQTPPSCFPGEGITFPPDYTCFGAFLNDTNLFNGISSIVCDQTFSPNLAAAPNFIIDYNTCTADCSGWQLSARNKPSQWAGALTAYILPAVIFSMTIPRWQKWEVPDRFFHLEKSKVSDIPFIAFFQAGSHAILALIVPGVIVSLDMAIWVFTIFILAGPMMVGGIYEAFIDWKILSILHDIPTRDDIIQGGETGRRGPHDVERHSANDVEGLSITNVDRRSMDGTDGHSNYGDERYDTRGQSQVELVETQTISLTNVEKIELLLAVLAGNLAIDVGNPKAYLKRAFKQGSLSRENWLERSHIRLRSMLHSQYSFGSMTGAPVLFYIGSFGYSIAFLSTNLGDNDTAHGLAFGMWWMAIVHVAIISGCLLASNNPSTTTVIVAPLLAEHNTSEGDDQSDGIAPVGENAQVGRVPQAQGQQSPREMFLQPTYQPIRRRPVPGQGSPVSEGTPANSPPIGAPQADSSITLQTFPSPEIQHVGVRNNRVYIDANNSIGMKRPSIAARNISESLHSERTPEEFNFLGMSPVYEYTPFLPVSIWDRGRVKRLWVEDSDAWRHNEWFQKLVELGAISFSVIPLLSFFLILFPSGLAFMVAYTTPRVGVSCRLVILLLWRFVRN
jgi:hypothetical protein